LSLILISDIYQFPPHAVWPDSVNPSVVVG
jgi:hypothetical protein